MIRLRLSAGDLRKIRFAYTPLWETVMSLRALTTATDNRFHRPWRRRAAAALRGGDVDLAFLTALVRPAGYIPD